jgi:transcriptional regulator
MPTPPLPLLPGTLDVLILKAASWRAEHGYGLARLIEHHSDGGLVVEEGALYPALHRLEQQGALRSTWGVSDNGRRARYYEITPAGRQRLRAGVRTWRRYVAAVAVILDHG